MKYFTTMILLVLLTVSLQQTPAAEEISFSKGYLHYEVHHGDTLWEIAKEHATEPYTIKTYVTEVKSINGIQGDTIYAGTNILVPVVLYPETEVAQDGD